MKENSEPEPECRHVVQQLALAEIGECLRRLYLYYDSSLNENVSTVDAHFLAHEADLARDLALHEQSTAAQRNFECLGIDTLEKAEAECVVDLVKSSDDQPTQLFFDYLGR